MKKLGKFFGILKRSAQSFSDDNGMKLSASLSYYTIFSIAPFLLVVIAIAGYAFGREAVEGKVYYEIKSLIGQDAALQVQNIIANIQLKDKGVWGTIIGTAILILGATGVFTEIQGSINYIWSLKSKPKKGWLKLIINQLISFSLVAGIGFILLASLLLNSLMDVFYARLQNLLSHTSVNVIYILNILLIFGVTTLLFTLIFKVLPDARIRWKDSIAGASFTAFLFIIGKFLIGLYIGNSRLGATYGTAASILIILVWIYYTSIILYFGAEFTKVYSREIGCSIEPNDDAVYIIKTESKEIPKTVQSPDDSPI